MRQLTPGALAIAWILGASCVVPNAALADPQTKLIAAEAQIAVVAQEGESGYQSQAGPYSGPGSERALIIQPSGLVTLQQRPGIEHELSATVDIVSAASANAVDATATASAVNEAIDVTGKSRIALNNEYRFHSGVGLHFEEPLRSARYQLGLERSLARGSAGVGLSLGMVLDTFDNHLPNGRSQSGDIKRRAAYNANLSFSQVLSPTTLLLLGYGFTHQRGTLRTPWNSVPLSGGLDGPMVRGGERFPELRHRHAATLELAQHIPGSHSTLRFDYRYYRDSFRVVAHNARFVFYQYLGPQVLVRTHYRFYTQTAAYFFGKSFPQTVLVQDGEQERTRPWLFEPAIYQTSDSDLDAFFANEVGTELSLLGGAGDALELGYTYYVRTNGLSAHLLSLGYVGRY